MSGFNIPRLEKKRQWALSLCGFCGYRDLQGRQRYFPGMCTAMICTNMIAGRLCTKVTHEKVICCNLGSTGCLICLCTLPLGFYHPIASMAGFCCLSNWLRSQVVQQYDVEEEKNFCCGPCNPYLDYCHFGCNYPCSLFQMDMSMEEWDAAIVAQATVAVIAPVYAQPISTVKHVYN